MGGIIYVDVKCMLSIFVNKPIRGKELHEYNHPSKMHQQRAIWSQAHNFLLASLLSLYMAA